MTQMPEKILQIAPKQNDAETIQKTRPIPFSCLSFTGKNMPWHQSLHIQIPHTQSITLNKRPAWLNLFTHQSRENFIRSNRVFDLHFE